MPFNRPSPTELRERIRGEIDILLPGSDARLRHSVENVLAGVLAMSSHELHGYMDWISKQILPDTAEAEILERHASIWGLIRKPSTPSTGIIQFTGADAAVIPAGTVVRRNDDVEYTLDADITIDGETGSGDITSVSSGAPNNTVIATKLTLINPVESVESEATVIDDGNGDGLTNGVNTENDDALRGRVIERIQQPPHGGADFDYIAWAIEVSGVTRAWVYPMQSGLGSVDVTFVIDDKVDTIIPSAAEVESVQDYIDTVRPVTAEVNVFAPTLVAVDFTIALNPNSLAVRQAVNSSLEDFFKRESEPGVTLYFSRMNEAISSATGEFDHALTLPAANVVPAYGEILTLGGITWSAL